MNIQPLYVLISGYYIFCLSLIYLWKKNEKLSLILRTQWIIIERIFRISITKQKMIHLIELIGMVLFRELYFTSRPDLNSQFLYSFTSKFASFHVFDDTKCFWWSKSILLKTLALKWWSIFFLIIFGADRELNFLFLNLHILYNLNCQYERTLTIFCTSNYVC